MGAYDTWSLSINADFLIELADTQCCKQAHKPHMQKPTVQCILNT